MATEFKKLTPLRGYALISSFDEAENKTKGGIILPDSAKEKQSHGIVEAIGGPEIVGGKETPCEIKVGEHVMYRKWGGDDIKFSGKEFKLVKFSDILAKYEK